MPKMPLARRVDEESRERVNELFKQFVFAMAVGDYKTARAADEEIERMVIEEGASSPFAQVQDN